MARESAPLSAAAGAAVLRARVGAGQVEVPGDFAIGVREMGGVGGGCDGDGVFFVYWSMKRTKRLKPGKFSVRSTRDRDKPLGNYYVVLFISKPLIRT